MGSFTVLEDLAVRWSTWDDWISTAVFSGLRVVGLSDASKPASRLTKHLPFIDSPTPAVTIILAYLLIVTVGSASLRRSQSTRGPDPGWLKLLVQVTDLAVSSCMWDTCLVSSNALAPIKPPPGA